MQSLAVQGVRPYVIFVTAYSDRSMDAFALGAIDYLLKPFDDERFARALMRAKSLISAGGVSGGAAAVPRPAMAAGRTRLLLAERGKVVVLAMRDIEFVQAAAKYVKIYAAGRCYSFRESSGSSSGGSIRDASCACIARHSSTSSTSPRCTRCFTAITS